MKKQVDVFLRMNLDLSELVGQSLTMVQRERNSWSFHLSGGNAIFTEEPWRLVTSHGTLISSEDDRINFGETGVVDSGDQLIGELQGETIVGAHYDNGSGDLRLEFSEDRTLQFLQLSSGYESWRLHLRDAEYICLGGGALAEFPHTRVV